MLLSVLNLIDYTSITRRLFLLNLFWRYTKVKRHFPNTYGPDCFILFNTSTWKYQKINSNTHHWILNLLVYITNKWINLSLPIVLDGAGDFLPFEGSVLNTSLKSSSLVNTFQCTIRAFSLRPSSWQWQQGLKRNSLDLETRQSGMFWPWMSLKYQHSQTTACPIQLV